MILMGFFFFTSNVLAGFQKHIFRKNGVVYSQLDGKEIKVCRKAIKTISFKMRNTFKDLFKTIF